MPRSKATRNPWDEPYKKVTSQGFFAPDGAWNDIQEMVVVSSILVYSPCKDAARDSFSYEGAPIIT